MDGKFLYSHNQSTCFVLISVGLTYVLINLMQVKGLKIQVETEVTILQMR